MKNLQIIVFLGLFLASMVGSAGFQKPVFATKLHGGCLALTAVGVVLAHPLAVAVNAYKQPIRGLAKARKTRLFRAVKSGFSKEMFLAPFKDIYRVFSSERSRNLACVNEPKKIDAIKKYVKTHKAFLVSAALFCGNVILSARAYSAYRTDINKFIDASFVQNVTRGEMAWFLSLATHDEIKSWDIVNCVSSYDLMRSAESILEEKKQDISVLRALCSPGSGIKNYLSRLGQECTKYDPVDPNYTFGVVWPNTSFVAGLASSSVPEVRDYPTYSVANFPKIPGTIGFVGGALKIRGATRPKGLAGRLEVYVPDSVVPIPQ